MIDLFNEEIKADSSEEAHLKFKIREKANYIKNPHLYIKNMTIEKVNNSTILVKVVLQTEETIELSFCGKEACRIGKDLKYRKENLAKIIHPLLLEKVWKI